ncbi:hypothetical protein RFI_28667 [Reticulomyxa filosa]|uniref:Uncharacterized protein n=1 Tax=Reticulomyxa filosa TaxID=46433 RepID=X6M458_RETFI|nr:hypothetical protein RFI_28667 [Reticulomyxa filosa]|eukprot:ETO08719.1 hypothetical protein RFI_28667 [Reticulomyxa filosa]
MVEAFPETDKTSYQLPRGWSHDQRQMALAELQSHQQKYEKQEGFSQYDMTEEEKKKLPVWITGQPNAFWEGGMPDISKYRWRPDLIDRLNQKGPAGIPPFEEEQIQKLLAEKIDPCDHQFRWMKAMIRTGKFQALGFH